MEKVVSPDNFTSELRKILLKYYNIHLFFPHCKSILKYLSPMRIFLPQFQVNRLVPFPVWKNVLAFKHKLHKALRHWTIFNAFSSRIIEL